MTLITPPELAATGQTITREIPGVGVLKFEDYPAGSWTTKKGQPGRTARRRYLLDGEELDSVSSIVDTLDKPALKWWIEDQATRGAVKAERMGELEGVHEDDWIRRVKALGIGASAKRDAGADRGTVIHAAMETLAKDGRPPNPADFPALARPWLQGATRAWLALDPELVAAEEIVCFPELRYAGRFDLIARCHGKLCLLDWKSGKGKVYESAHFSTRLYEMAARRSLGLEVERVVIVGIGDDGGFELIDCAVDPVEAEALLDIARARKRVNAEMAKQRKIARAA